MGTDLLYIIHFYPQDGTLTENSWVEIRAGQGTQGPSTMPELKGKSLLFYIES